MLEHARGSHRLKLLRMGLGGTSVNHVPMHWERLHVLDACVVADATLAYGCDIRAPSVNEPDQTTMAISMMRNALSDELTEPEHEHKELARPVGGRGANIATTAASLPYIGLACN